MCGRPWVFAPEPISSVKAASSRPDLRTRFLPTRRCVRCTWARISNYRLGLEKYVEAESAASHRSATDHDAAAAASDPAAAAALARLAGPCPRDPRNQCDAG